VNRTKYYCVFRNLWDEAHHPKSYPALARWSDPVIYSSTKQYMPWLRNRQTSYGIEKLAEVCTIGFTALTKLSINSMHFAMAQTHRLPFFFSLL
jgi:hypothetical protein